MTSAGAVQDMTGRLEKGETYQVSAAVRYNVSENPKATWDRRSFFASIIYGDGKDRKIWHSVTTAGDKWAVIEGKYTVPAGADLSNVRVFIETAYKGGSCCTGSGILLCG